MELKEDLSTESSIDKLLPVREKSTLHNHHREYNHHTPGRFAHLFHIAQPVVPAASILLISFNG